MYRSSSVTLYPCESFKNVWEKMMHKLVIDAIIYIFQKRWRNGRNSFCEISRPVKVKGKVFHVLTFCKRNDTFIERNWIGKNCFGGLGDSFCNKCILKVEFQKDFPLKWCQTDLCYSRTTRRSNEGSLVDKGLLWWYWN